MKEYKTMGEKAKAVYQNPIDDWRQVKRITNTTYSNYKGRRLIRSKHAKEKDHVMSESKELE